MTGKILLSGFELEPAERAIVDNILKNYNHKISERGDYEYIKLDLKKTQKGKNFLNYIRGTLKSGKLLLKSETTDYNLFAAVAEVLDKLLIERIHKSRTSRQKK